MSVVSEAISVSPVPPITHPYGKHWDQPSVERMAFYANRVVMDERTFRALSDYSCSMPSGVYEGKMWRRCQGKHTSLPKEQWRWFLCWFGPSSNPDCCSTNVLPLVVE